MSELRQDRTSGAWVIVAPERGRRPRQWNQDEVAAERMLGFDPSCPFCPGNERLLAEIIEETRRDWPPGWCTRVVANKYPALRPDAVTGAATGCDGSTMPGYGFHEVIIETGRHDADLITLEAPELTAVIETYQRRSAALAARPGIEAVLVFRNFGRRAGASLAHPHSQVIAVGMAPPRLAATEAWAHAHYERAGRCATCEEIDRELDGGRRIVEASERFVALVPFAAVSPFEQRILPRRHQASLAEAVAEDLSELGWLLQRCLRRMNAALGSPPYNCYIGSIAGKKSGSPSDHWGFHIVPDIVTQGGFELGTGLPINPSLPEDDAAVLRLVNLACQMGET